MKLPKIPFISQSKPKFEPTPEESILIERCAMPGMGHIERDQLVEEANLISDRRSHVEEIIRQKVMESVLRGSRERQA